MHCQKISAKFKFHGPMPPKYRTLITMQKVNKAIGGRATCL